MANTTEVDTREDRGPIDVSRVPEHVRTMLQRLDVNATSDTASAQLDIMSRILEATTEEEIFAAANAGTVSGQSVAGRNFLLHSFDWKRSAPAFVQQGAFPFYALCRVTMMDTGEDHVLDCGGFTFVSVLDGLDRLGAIEAKENGQGGYPMVLEARPMPSGFTVLIPHPAKVPAASK